MRLNVAILFGIFYLGVAMTKNAITVTDVVLHCGNLGKDAS
jgi:hypothetical protein